MSGLQSDRPGELAIFMALMIAIVVPDLLIAEGPWLWSEALELGEGTGGKAWLINSLAPYLTVFAATALVLGVLRWLL